MDTNLTWLVHGPGESLGFETRESGYDVFLGNYRGVYPRKLAKWKEGSDYWSYSIDHIARHDIYAFMTKIFEIKVKEFKESENCDGLSEHQIKKIVREKLKITYIGHSCGG